MTVAQRAIFKDGFLFEADTLTRLEAGGVWIINVGRTVRHPDLEIIQGHIDAEITHPPTGKAYIVEIKSMRGYPQQKTLGGKKHNHVAREHVGGWVLKAGTTRAVQPEYWAQVQCYMWASRAEEGVGDGCIMIYRMKEDGRIAVEYIEYDAERAREMLARVECVAGSHAEAMLPSCEYDPNSEKDWQCGYCAYRETCAVLPAGRVPYADLASRKEA